MHLAPGDRAKEQLLNGNIQRFADRGGGLALIVKWGKGAYGARLLARITGRVVPVMLRG